MSRRYGVAWKGYFVAGLEGQNTVTEAAGGEALWTGLDVLRSWPTIPDRLKCVGHKKSQPRLVAACRVGSWNSDPSSPGQARDCPDGTSKTGASWIGLAAIFIQSGASAFHQSSSRGQGEMRWA
jgi:hypothetical protein